MKRLAVIGGGPAGLIAAEVANAERVAVDVYESRGSVGRKFLLAGKGGLNLTHSEDSAAFIARYGSSSGVVADWLSAFNANDLRAWARGLGIDTFVGTSGRVFPTEMKSAPLLRAWVRRLRAQGVNFYVNHRCIGIVDRELRFATPGGTEIKPADAIVCATGGASWPQLGSDGRWVEWFSEHDITPLRPANCGFDAGWTAVFAERFAGHPVKSVKVSTRDLAGHVQRVQGEFVITANGVEGSAIYALSAILRDEIERTGYADLHLDLAPDTPIEKLVGKLSRSRDGRSLTEHLRRAVGIEGVKAGLLYECARNLKAANANEIASAIKALNVRLLRPRPIEESISTAGGIRLAALDSNLMVRSMPGVFCAGEMLDWEAPTGGYLLTACFASGRVAAQGAVDWLKR